MDIQWVAIDSIKPYPCNPRKNMQAVDKVAQSIKTYGWQQAIVVDVEQTIIAGHTRWLAAKQLGLLQVPINIAKELTPDQVRAYRIADNRLSEEAEWDEALLRQELLLLKEVQAELASTGYDESEITKLLGSLMEPDTESTEWLTLQSTIVSKRGDIWELDKHRVMCGDSTSAQDMPLLMAGFSADLVFTDPPYNVDYTQLRSTDLTRRIQNDALDAADYYEFLKSAFAQAASWVSNIASWYICHAAQSQTLVEQALINNDISIRCQIIWAKNHFVLNRGRIDPKTTGTHIVREAVRTAMEHAVSYTDYCQQISNISLSTLGKDALALVAQNSKAGQAIQENQIKVEGHLLKESYALAASEKINQKILLTDKQSSRGLGEKDLSMSSDQVSNPSSHRQIEKEPEI